MGNPYIEEEEKVMDLIVEAHNLFLKLEQTHPSDKPDWVNGVHKLQDRMSGRIVRRDYPDHFPSYKVSKEETHVKN